MARAERLLYEFLSAGYLSLAPVDQVPVGITTTTWGEGERVRLDNDICCSYTCGQHIEVFFDYLQPILPIP